MLSGALYRPFHALHAGPEAVNDGPGRFRRDRFQRVLILDECKQSLARGLPLSGKFPLLAGDERVFNPFHPSSSSVKTGESPEDQSPGGLDDLIVEREFVLRQRRPF